MGTDHEKDGNLLGTANMAAALKAIRNA